MSVISRYGRQYEIPDDMFVIPGKCTVDLKNHCIIVSDSELRKLTPKFLILLAYFYENRNKKLESAVIADHIFGLSDKGTTEQVKKAVSDLRVLLDDEEPYTVILTGERGFGTYEFVLKENTGAAAPESMSDVKAEKSGAYRKYGSEKVLAGLENALEELTKAESIDALQRARTNVKYAIDRYANEVTSRLFSNMAEDSPDDTSRDIEISRHQVWLIKTLNFYKEAVLSSANDSLADIRCEILDLEREWHIYTAFLRVQILAEQEALVLEGSLIEKEVQLRLISNLNRDYRYAKEEAIRAEMSMEDKIDGCGKGISADTKL